MQNENELHQEYKSGEDSQDQAACKERRTVAQGSCTFVAQGFCTFDAVTVRLFIWMTRSTAV